MTPETVLRAVMTAVDSLVESGQSYHGLIPSLLDRASGTMLKDLPDPIPGQRSGDRSPEGCNLIHDEPLLAVMYRLAAVCHRPSYAAAVDAYLKHFAAHCTDTATGLLPWGEHAYWHLPGDQIGGRIHDHLRQVPLWLWQRLADFNPECVQRFADGLNFHWVDAPQPEYIRHAHLLERTHPRPGPRSCDFPRHAGFYIFDWAYAYSQVQRPETMANIEAMTDYWWKKRADSGLLLIESRSPEDQPRFCRQYSPPQTISLAASLIEAADLLASSAPHLANTMRIRAGVYAAGFTAAPHRLAEGGCVNLCGADGSVREWMSVWGSVYGTPPAASSALISLLVYRRTQDERLLQWAQAAAQRYRSQPFPPSAGAKTADGQYPSDRRHLVGHGFVPAKDCGLVLELFAELWDVTGDSQWCEAGWDLAAKCVEAFFDQPLPRGALGIDWYESQLGPAFLLHGLTRLALMRRDGISEHTTANYTER